MSVSSAQSNTARLKKKIASLDTKVSQETGKESRKFKDLLNAKKSVSRTTNLSSLRSKERNINQLITDIAKIQKTKSKYEGQVAGKTEEFHRSERQLAHEQEREQKKLESEQKRHFREMANMQRSQQVKEIQHHRSVRRELEKQAQFYLLLQNKPAKLWRIGSFWLLSFTLISSIVSVIATSLVSWWILILVFLAIEIFVVTSGAFILRSIGDLSEKGFLELMELAFKFQIKGLRSLRKDNTALESEEEIE